MKRLRLIRWCVMVACLMCAVSAGAYSFKSGNIYYTITGNDPATVEVANSGDDANKYSGAVYIPSTVTYGGTSYRVTGIGDEAFSQCHELTFVSLPSSVTYLNNYAFYNCVGLGNVVLPSGLTSLGAYAFGLCSGSGFTRVIIPDAVTSIGYGAFYRCPNLTTVTLGSGVTYIKENVFMYCAALTNVTSMAMTPPSMHSRAFEQSQYSSVSLKVPLSSLSAYQANSAWAQFSHIATLNYDFVKNYIYYKIHDANAKNVTVTYDTYGCYSGAVTIPETVTNDNVNYTVTRIDSHAFYNCTELRYVTLPNTIEYIGTYAFNGCTVLTEITIPDKAWYVGSWAFMGCTSLRSVVLGAGLTSMGNKVFTGCTSLTSVRCKAYSPPTIMDATLSDQYAIATLTVPDMSTSAYESAQYWSNFTTIQAADYDFYAAPLYYIRTGNNTVSVTYRDKNYNSYRGDVVIPDQVTYDGVTYSVTGIRANAFYHCSDLTSIQFPQSSLKQIGGAAFAECTSLTKVDIPNSVTHVGGMAFYGCTKLKHAIIGENCSFAGQYNVFNNCNNLEYVTCFAKTPPVIYESVFPQAAYDNAWLSVPSGSIDLYAAADNWKKFQRMDATKSDFMVDGIYYKIIFGDNVGVACKDLSFGTYQGNITVPSTVQYEGVTYQVTLIYSNAFAECPNLTSVTLPSTITFIDYNAFRDCGISSIVVPDAVSGIGDSAFQMCHNLTKVTLGSGLNNMVGGVFHDTPNLETITCRATTPPIIVDNTFEENHYNNTKLYVPKSTGAGYRSADYWSNFSNIYELNYDFEEDGIYYNITSSNTVEVTSRTTDYSTYSDSYEGAVVIPETVPHNGVTYTVNAIGNNAFKMCKGLTSITMPNSIKIIGSYAFHYCEELTEVVIPNSVTTIMNNAFWLCLNLGEVVIPNSVETVGSMAFRNCSELTRVVIGKNVTSIGSTCFYYCPNITEVTCLAEVPPTLTESGSSTTFAPQAYQNAILRVPYASHESYYNNANWGRFNTIVSKQNIEMVTTGDVNGDGNVSISDVTALIDLLLSGGTINNSAADVNGDNNVSISDVTALIDQLLSGNGGGGSTASGPARREFVINNYHFNLIKVDGGTFMMGLEGDALASPVHQVTLTDYHIGETEVTQALWTLVMGSNPSNHQGDGSLPVENMDWNDCQEFITKLNAMYEENFSLPTEAQWEFAARGGNKSQGYVYSGSNTLGAVAWYSGNSGGASHLVATLVANELGLYDMSGNVFEWCQDTWGAYTSDAQIDPQGPLTGEDRVCRGSAYNRDNNNNWFKCGGRTYDSPTNAAYDTGLRLAIQPSND